MVDYTESFLDQIVEIHFPPHKFGAVVVWPLTSTSDGNFQPLNNVVRLTSNNWGMNIDNSTEILHGANPYPASGITISSNGPSFGQSVPIPQQDRTSRITKDMANKLFMWRYSQAFLVPTASGNVTGVFGVSCINTQAVLTKGTNGTLPFFHAGFRLDPADFTHNTHQVAIGVVPFTGPNAGIVPTPTFSDDVLFKDLISPQFGVLTLNHREFSVIVHADALLDVDFQIP